MSGEEVRVEQRQQCEFKAYRSVICHSVAKTRRVVTNVAPGHASSVASAKLYPAAGGAGDLMYRIHHKCRRHDTLGVPFLGAPYQ